MRFVALKTEEQQARSMIFRTRDLLVRQRTQLVNALRGHLAEHGIVAAHGLAKVKVLATAMRDTASLHPLVRELGQRYLDHIARLDAEIAELDKRLRRSSKDDETAKRLQTMPGMGPITAAAIEAFAPPMATFRRGRDFAAWLGLVPRQHTTGGKPRLGRTSKMGQRDIRRLASQVDDLHPALLEDRAIGLLVGISAPRRVELRARKLDRPSARSSREMNRVNWAGRGPASISAIWRRKTSTSMSGEASITSRILGESPDHGSPSASAIR